MIMKLLTSLRPSPAMVVACIALAVALGGTSYAAITLPKNSVGPKQLKKNAVTPVKVRANAITSPKVASNTLTGADINEATLGTVPSATSATTAGSAAPSGGAGGGLAGAYPNPTIAANAVASANVVDAANAAGLRKVDIAAVSTTVSFDPPNLGAGECGADGAPVTGAQPGDVIIAHPVNTVWGGLVYMPWTVLAGSVYMRFCNPGPVASDGGAVPFYVLLIR
jgi:hypothetical protein